MRDRIINLMKQLGMSQKNFAAEICISEGALSSIYSGRTKPTLNTITNIHERFPEVNLSWLVDGKGDMFVSAGSPSGSADMGNLFSASNMSAPQADQPMASVTPQFAMPMGAPQAVYAPVDSKNFDKSARRIAEIRVFYDDGTFETFPGNV